MLSSSPGDNLTLEEPQPQFRDAAFSLPRETEERSSQKIAFDLDLEEWPRER